MRLAARAREARANQYDGFDMNVRRGLGLDVLLFVPNQLLHLCCACMAGGQRQPVRRLRHERAPGGWGDYMFSLFPNPVLVGVLCGRPLGRAPWNDDGASHRAGTAQ